MVYLMHGNKWVCQAYSPHESNINGFTVSCNYFIELKAGETVYCKLEAGTITSGKWSQFHGMRIN